MSRAGNVFQKTTFQRMGTMKSMIRCTLLAGLWFSLVSLAAAETKVEVSGLHNCCGACLKGISKAVTSAGAEAQINAGDDAVTITAPDKDTAQKAVDNLAAAGYHGTVKGDGVTMKEDSGAPAGKVAKVEVTGAHNCCKGCSIAIGDACKEVSGVSSTSIVPKKTSFTVEGDFDAQALVKALNDAGFHVKVATK
jgi:mercuric ion binding protein